MLWSDHSVKGETEAKANQLICVCTSFDFFNSCTVFEVPDARFVNSAEIETQHKIWEHIWVEVLEKCVLVPETANTSAECNGNLMPAVFRILKIFATPPITTTTSDRNFSTLKQGED